MISKAVVNSMGEIEQPIAFWRCRLPDMVSCVAHVDVVKIGGQQVLDATRNVEDI